MSQTDEAERIGAASEHLRTHLGEGANSRFGVILGSGLGAFVEQLADAVAVDYGAIPHFPTSAVPGHAGRLVAGTVSNQRVLVLQGRVHGYEGHTAQAIAFGVRVLAKLGVRMLVLTNAAGAVRVSLRPGQLVALSDHINFSGMNPAAGPALGRAPRFFDMSEAYSPRLRALARQAAEQHGFELPEGVYIGVSGPSFETPAEIRAFRTLGADLVGMSTVLETIAARQAGMEVLGISCVTNMAAGIDASPLSHDEVLATGRAVESRMAALLTSLIGVAGDGA